SYPPAALWPAVPRLLRSSLPLSPGGPDCYNVLEGSAAQHPRGDTGGCIPPTRPTMYSSDDVAARLQQRLEASILAAGDPVLAGIILQLGARAEVDPAAGDYWARHWNEQTIAHLQGVDEQA